jgi:hypothetical protein
MRIRFGISTSGASSTVVMLMLGMSLETLPLAFVSLMPFAAAATVFLFSCV